MFLQAHLRLTLQLHCVLGNVCFFAVVFVLPHVRASVEFATGSRFFITFFFNVSSIILFDTCTPVHGHVCSRAILSIIHALRFNWCSADLIGFCARENFSTHTHVKMKSRTMPPGSLIYLFVLVFCSLHFKVKCSLVFIHILCVGKKGRGGNLLSHTTFFSHQFHSSSQI